MLPKNDFTRKMIDFGIFTKLPKNVGDLGKFVVAKGFKICSKSNKLPNLITLIKTSKNATKCSIDRSISGRGAIYRCLGLHEI